MSLSLIAVFVPIWFMGGIVGRFFREFAVVMSAAILVSMVISLTTTPMMSRSLAAPAAMQYAAARAGGGTRCRRPGRARGCVRPTWRRSLAWCLRHPLLVLLALAGGHRASTSISDTAIDKGFMPSEDTGRVMGFIRADQATLLPGHGAAPAALSGHGAADPAVEHVTGFTGGGSATRP